MDATPRYRIHHVAAETGLPASVLRAWERRYGVPTPQRGENGYRLYSEHDVGLLRRMKRLTEAGHAPAEAARRARQSEAMAPGVAGQTSFEGLADRLAAAALRFDDDQMQAVHHAASALGSGWDLHARVVWPALQAVAQTSATHGPAAFATLANVAGCWQRRALRLLQPPPQAPRVLLFAGGAAEPGAAVRLGGLGLLAAQTGWRSVVVDQPVPGAALAAAASALTPDLLLCWFERPGPAPALPGRWIAAGPGAPADAPARWPDPDAVLAGLRAQGPA